MSLQCRFARASDLVPLEQLCLGQAHRDSVLISVEAQQRQYLQYLNGTLQTPEDYPDARILVVSEADGQVLGYALIVLGEMEPMTMETQAQIVDIVAPSFDVLQCLIARIDALAGEVENQFLVIRVPEVDKRKQVWLYRSGFRPEYNRVVKPIAAGHRGPASARYLARPAREGERSFLIRVNAEHCGHYAAAGRAVDPDAIRVFFFFSLSAADLSHPDFRYIILEDTTTREAAGYIILQRQGPDYYTIDVAVAPEYAGRGLSLYLCGAAETLLGESGGGILYGDTSPENLAGVNGDRQLGFTIESRRWGRAVNLDNRSAAS